MKVQAGVRQDDIRLLEQSLRGIRREEVIKEAREHLVPFTRFTMPHPEHADDADWSSYDNQLFHDEIGKALERVERGEITQLIFCMPPRHGKTELATKRLAAWYSGRHPSHNIAVGTYSDTMAEDIGADVRSIFDSPSFKQVFPKYHLRAGGKSKSNMQSMLGGRMVFVGRGGALTGRGAHLLLIDDLFKDHEEARSQAIRDQAWNWFTKVAMSRRMGKKLVIITMTRWHSDDIVGRLTDPENPNYNAVEAKNWHIIRLPAIAEDDDPAGRKPGEALWPDRYGLDFLLQMKRLDAMGFASLYQQSPTVAEGVYFKREYFQRYRYADLPDDLRIYAASDHAVATGQRNDFTVFVKVGVDKQDNIYLLDLYRKRANSEDAVEAILTMCSGNMRPIIWWAESGHISKSIGPFLKKRMVETKIFVAISEVTPVNDKVQRAQSFIARASMGKFYIPFDAPWAEALISELLGFPAGNHDDQVDALSLIGLGLRSMAPAAPPKNANENKEPAYGTLAWAKYQQKWQKRQRELAAAGGF